MIPGYISTNTRPQTASLILALKRHLISASVAVFIFYASLMMTSAGPDSGQVEIIGRAIAVLEAKGFTGEAFMLRHTAAFRSSDHWLNAIVFKENSYAATNFPFEIITLYPDFYSKATDDTERAMILLHEAQHLQGNGERDAYAYVWQNRSRFGWTQLSHGTTDSYVTIEEQTRENAPELFTCRANLWNDCTEMLHARK